MYSVTLDGTAAKALPSGKLSRREASSVREASDTEYGKRMQQARAQLAQEMAAVAPLSLTQLRLKKGMSQTELAKRLATSQSHIAKIEAGKTDLYLRTAIKLADALSISLDVLRGIVEINQSEEPLKEIVLIGQL